VIGHSITGTLDQGMTAEGLWTTFRELKPGTTDAVFDGWAPLRWCLFAEPLNVYRKTPVRLEAVLANEDALMPGKYPVRLLVVGPNAVRVWEKTVSVTIPERGKKPEPPMVMPVFSEEVAIDGPSGKYRFLATFERGAAAAGGSAEFHVTDPAEMPPVEAEVAIWGEDADLAKWLTSHGIRTRLYTAAPQARREVILVSGKPSPAPDAAAFAELARRIGRGSTAIFLTPHALAKKDQPTGWLPLVNKGTIAGLPSWLYHKDEWCKRHAIFEGLPAGGLMDYAVYREIIPDAAFVGLDPPDETVAAGINASQPAPYVSGVFVGIYKLGEGRLVLNTLRIRENLGPNPAAERLLRNLLCYGAQEP
jgi:hypothetical protein